VRRAAYWLLALGIAVRAGSLYAPSWLTALGASRQFIDETLRFPLWAASKLGLLAVIVGAVWLLAKEADKRLR
jgi:hypothetical protein